MVAHVVLFRPRAALSACERSALVDALATALREIPGIVRSSVGRRLTHGRAYERLMKDDYEFAAVIEFADAAGLQAYLDHPAHRQLARSFQAAFDAALMYDYEMADGASGLAGVAEHLRAR